MDRPNRSETTSKQTQNLRLRGSLLAPVGGLLLAGLLALAIDLPAARWFAQGYMPKVVQHLLEVTEDFADGMGVILIVVAVWMIDRARRERVWRLLAGALCAGLAADLLKFTVVRFRPRELDLAATGLADTFGQLGSLFSGSGQGDSFPSAHAATAFGLAIVLASQYPQARRYFFLLASLAAAQRVVVAAHFPSDVLCGAAVGWAVGWLMVGYGPICRWFDRLEGKALPAKPAIYAKHRPALEHIAGTTGSESIQVMSVGYRGPMVEVAQRRVAVVDWETGPQAPRQGVPAPMFRSAWTTQTHRPV